ncbi:MAG: sulfatase [Deltaproteobacteria bacterium]|nr:sulfatase [Deltaproteobacteria bacterium]
MRATAVLLMLALLLGCSGAGREPPRNLLLISVDTLRADRLGAWGHAPHVSPFLDSLAEQGVVFEQTVAQSPWTAPSHAAMLTSTWPSLFGFAGAYTGPETQGFIHSDAISLAEVLRDAGWRTQAVTAGGFVAARFGFDQGFEAYGERGATLRAAVAQALAWLDARDGDEPFFLFLHTYDVKRYRAGSAQRKLLESRHGIRLPDRRPLAALLQSNDVKALPEITPAFRAFVVELYDAAITRADTELHRLWQELERRDLAAATLFVVTSDHGEEFWEHGSSGHGYSLHDENVRVPLILRHPSLTPQRIAAQVRLVDLAPTLVHLLGLAVPQAWSGVSLVPWIEGTGEDLPAFSEAAHRPLKAVRTPSYKLVLSAAPPRLEFFDLGRDPGETRALADRSHPQREPLERLLRRWIEANAADRRFASGGAAKLSPQVRRQLAQLGYAGDREESRRLSTERWLEILSEADRAR